MINTLEQAIEHYGPDMQINVAIEELSELIKELCKFKRGQGNQVNLAEEMADVKIILKELEIIFNNSELVSVWQEVKIDRLQERIKKE